MLLKDLQRNENYSDNHKERNKQNKTLNIFNTIAISKQADSALTNIKDLLKSSSQIIPKDSASREKDIKFT